MFVFSLTVACPHHLYSQPRAAGGEGGGGGGGGGILLWLLWTEVCEGRNRVRQHREISEMTEKEVKGGKRR